MAGGAIHVKATINNVIPGLTGIGSIVFRDEERLLYAYLPNRMGYFGPKKRFSLHRFQRFTGEAGNNELMTPVPERSSGTGVQGVGNQND